MAVDAPSLHPPDPAWLAGPSDGYVVERDGWYWTGMGQDAAWSRNPRRALVDAVAPLQVQGRDLQGARCVRVILENEVTMLPLHMWPRPMAKESAS